MHPEMNYKVQMLQKLCKGYATAWHFIQKFSKIVIKLLVLGYNTLIFASMG